MVDSKSTVITTSLSEKWHRHTYWAFSNAHNTTNGKSWRSCKTVIVTITPLTWRETTTSPTATVGELPGTELMTQRFCFENRKRTPYCNSWRSCDSNQWWERDLALLGLQSLLESKRESLDHFVEVEALVEVHLEATTARSLVMQMQTDIPCHCVRLSHNQWLNGYQQNLKEHIILTSEGGHDFYIPLIFLSWNCYCF